MLKSVTEHAEYKVIYRSYSHTQLAARNAFVRNREEFEVDNMVKCEAQSVYEAKDWSDNLNTFAHEGFVVINSGTLQLFDNIVFWALLERAPDKPQIQR
jgi:hypothetical protein